MVPLPQDRWLIVGTRTFRVFFPELSREATEHPSRALDCQKAADEQLRRFVQQIASRYGQGDAETVDDLTQDLRIRVAEMDAASRYTPNVSKPGTFLRAIAGYVVLERVGRRRLRNVARLGELDSELADPVAPESELVD